MAHEHFDELFRDLYVPAFGVALRVLGNRHEAEEVACEALARTAASWQRVRGLPYQRAWVLRVTANVAVDVLRKRRPPVQSAQVTARLTDPDDRVLLAAALRRLPRRQREVLVLRFLADMTEVQVAEHLDISRSAVKQHCSRGLVRLRELMGSPVEEVSLAC
ncbi:MAG TPA: sigma-70 family RNA polymerase sigma factor [Acidimicrobiales bacterium]|nr:sigma-70 family RNA polymerase sigma factor [Acidimicrobiales bacterium]